MDCKACYHYKVCISAFGIGAPKIYPDCFKDKSKIIELPCTVGDILYALLKRWQTPEIFECKIVCINYSINKKEQIKNTFRISHYNSNGYAQFTYDFNVSDFGKTVFLTKEEAKKAMEERNNEDE